MLPAVIVQRVVPTLPTKYSLIFDDHTDYHGDYETSRQPTSSSATTTTQCSYSQNSNMRAGPFRRPAWRGQAGGLGRVRVLSDGTPHSHHTHKHAPHTGAVQEPPGWGRVIDEDLPTERCRNRGKIFRSVQRVRLNKPRTARTHRRERNQDQAKPGRWPQHWKH